MNVLLVCSPGGHLQQMLALEPAWREMDRAWVTLAGPDVEYLLADEETTLGHGPTNRSLEQALPQPPARLAGAARKRRPDAIISTGAGLAVPFFTVGKLLGIRLIYVESLTRTESISLSGRMVYPLADRFFTQWPATAALRRRAEYAGSVL